jgi:ABC-type antimicrobial peptide transport system permease subunit
MSVAAAGAAVGLVVAFASARALEPFLFSVEPRDPALFAATAVLLLTVAAVAAFVPAQRATRVNPIEVLKAD